MSGFAKSDEISIGLKEVANEELKRNDLKSALFHYNMAICYAKSKKNLALAYASRSLVYLKLEKYDECLLNIKWARETGYLKEMIQKLNEIEDKAKKLKAAQVKDPVEDPWNFFKLSHPANPKIPFIVDCLEMKKTEKFGRGIYATRDISTGDILSIEDSFLTTSSNKGFDIPEDRRFCENCLKTCMLNLIPSTVSNNSMFCTTECRDKNSKNWFGVFFPDITEKFGGNSTDFLRSVPDITKLDFSVFDFDWSDPNDSEYGANQVKCFLSSKVPLNTANRSTLPANSRSTKLSGQLIAELHLHASSIIKTFWKNPNISRLSTFGKLINHSCIPNVERFQVEGKVIITASKPIKAGEQLFESYHVLDSTIPTSPPSVKRLHYMSEATVARKASCLKVFDFTCDCCACEEDLDESKCRIFDQAAVSLIQMETDRAVKSKSLKPAIEQLKINNQFITKHHKNLLSKDVYIAQNCNNDILRRIGTAACYPI